MRSLHIQSNLDWGRLVSSDYWPSCKVSPYARGAKLKAALFPSLSPSPNWLYSGMQTPKTIKHNWKLMKYSFVLVLATLLHGSNSVYISKKKIWVSFCKFGADIRCLKTSWHSSSVLENSTYCTFADDTTTQKCAIFFLQRRNSTLSIIWQVTSESWG